MNFLRRAHCHRRPSVRLAPDPASTPEPVVQVYGARCAGVRGLFGIHTWIAVKPRGASSFTVYQVIGRRARARGPVLAAWKRAPDTPWWGNVPEVLADRRGDGVDALIERIERAAREYPYAREYVIWPGPNSNTFTAHIARVVPELDLDLPPTAIGKDYLGNKLRGTAPSGHGTQVSLLGVVGALASRIEGFEINVLGLALGIDPFSPALRLPILGRIGAARLRPPLSGRRALEPTGPTSPVVSGPAR